MKTGFNWTRRDTLDLMLVLGLCFFVFLLNTWAYPLFDVDEPRYAETAREMLLRHGDWITPHFNGLPRFDKPILFYWLIALSYKGFGVSAFSARLVSALSASGIALMLYALMRNVFNRNTALITVAIFSTMAEVYLLGRWAITDMTLCFCMAGTWFSFYGVLAKSPRWYVAAGLLGALGMLTKGPVAVALPVLTFLIALAWLYRPQWRILYSPWAVFGALVFLMVATPWYWAVAQANPGQFVGSFFFLHNVERFATTVSGHHGVWYYYIIIIFMGTFPWVFFLPGLIAQLNQAYRQHAVPPLVSFALIWIGVVFCFFSLAATKLLTYVLPFFPAFAILLGWFWHQQFQMPVFSQIHNGLRETGRLLMWPTLALSVALLGVTFNNPNLLLPHALRLVVPAMLLQSGAFCMVAGVIGLIILLHQPQRPQQQYKVIQGMVLLLYGYLNLVIFPQVANVFQADILAFALRAKQDKMPLATYQMKKPSLVFYAQEKVDYISNNIKEFNSNLLQKMPQTVSNLPRLRYVVVANRTLPTLKQHYAVQPILNGKVYSLVSVYNAHLIENINQ